MLPAVKTSHLPEFRQWDVVRVRINPNDRDEHFAVILSPDEVVAGRAVLNVLSGSSKQPRDQIGPGEVILDEAEGLERPTIINCAFFPVIRKAQISRTVGFVGAERRRVLMRTIAASLRFFR